MTANRFTITPDHHAFAGLEPGQQGKLTFRVSSLAAPGEVHEVIPRALLVGEGGQAEEVDWLVAEPMEPLRIAGGMTETVSIVARATPTTPKGKNTIKLAIANKDRPSEVYAESPTVTFSVVAPPPSTRRARRRLPWWSVVAILGALLLVGGGVLLAWNLLHKEPDTAPPPDTAPLALGESCGGDTARVCGEGLLCAAGSQRCLLAGGAGCTPARADLCASAECASETKICAIPAGGACTPGDGQAPCSKSAPLCHAGRCQCAANQGDACNCGGVSRCDGTCSLPACQGSCRNGRCCIFSGDPACDTKRPPRRKRDLNSYILRAVDLLYQNHRDKGYDINAYYTHDIDYSRPSEIKASTREPKTMCVAAVSEVIIVALRLYADESGDRSVFDKLPARSWTGVRVLDIRPYIFMFEDQRIESDGTADALRQFGIGEIRPFPLLVPGDFINFNRDDGRGHAVVFMGFLNASGEPEPRYDSKKVVGFKYFSAQGRNPKAGFGYKWAYFSGHCPREAAPDKPRDCGVIPSNRQNLLNTGYMWHPTLWKTDRAMRELRAKIIRQHRLELVDPVQRNALIERELSRELAPKSKINFDGITTDD